MSPADAWEAPRRTPAGAYVSIAWAEARRLVEEPVRLVPIIAFYLGATAVLLSLWRAGVAANGGSILGYDARALAWYVMLTEASVAALPAPLIRDTIEDIDSGAITAQMLLPASVVGVRTARHVGSGVVRASACFVFGTAFVWVVEGAPPHLGTLALSWPLLLIGVVLGVGAQHAIAAAGFWLRESRSVWFLYQKLVFIAGGMLLPIEVLPDAIESVSRVSPFAAMTYLPGRFASGHFDWSGVALSALWLVALLWLADRAFAAGERKLLEVGS